MLLDFALLAVAADTTVVSVLGLRGQLGISLRACRCFRAIVNKGIHISMGNATALLPLGVRGFDIIASLF